MKASFFFGKRARITIGTVARYCFTTSAAFCALRGGVDTCNNFCKASAVKNLSITGPFMIAHLLRKNKAKLNAELRLMRTTVSRTGHETICSRDMEAVLADVWAGVDTCDSHLTDNKDGA